MSSQQREEEGYLISRDDSGYLCLVFLESLLVKWSWFAPTTFKI